MIVGPTRLWFWCFRKAPFLSCAAFRPGSYGSWFNAVVNLAQDRKAPLLSCAAFRPSGYGSGSLAAVTSAFPENALLLFRGSVQGLWKPGPHTCESGGCPPLLYPTAGRGVEFSVNSSILCRVLVWRLRKPVPRGGVPAVPRNSAHFLPRLSLAITEAGPARRRSGSSEKFCTLSAAFQSGGCGNDSKRQNFRQTGRPGGRPLRRCAGAAALGGPLAAMMKATI